MENSKKETSMKKYILDDVAYLELREKISELGFADEFSQTLNQLAYTLHQGELQKKLGSEIEQMVADGITLLKSTDSSIADKERQIVASHLVKVSEFVIAVVDSEQENKTEDYFASKKQEIEDYKISVKSDYKSCDPNRVGQFLSVALLVLSLLAAAVVVATLVATAPISLPAIAGAGATAAAKAGLAAVAANQVIIGATAATGAAAGIVGLALSRDASPRFKFSAEKVVKTLADDVSERLAPAKS